MRRSVSYISKACNIFQVSFIFIFFSPMTAYAYVDPGSGSVIVTAILGFLAAITYSFRKYFYKIRKAIFKVEDKDTSEEDNI